MERVCEVELVSAGLKEENGANELTSTSAEQALVGSVDDEVDSEGLSQQH